MLSVNSNKWITAILLHCWIVLCQHFYKTILSQKSFSEKFQGEALTIFTYFSNFVSRFSLVLQFQKSILQFTVVAIFHYDKSVSKNFQSFFFLWKPVVKTWYVRIEQLLLPETFIFARYVLKNVCWYEIFHDLSALQGRYFYRYLSEHLLWCVCLNLFDRCLRKRRWKMSRKNIFEDVWLL